jgi:hypothetical protein
MPTYRFYKLSSGKRIVAFGEDRDFDDDNPALAHARVLSNGHAVGVWQGARFVANVESDDSSPRGELQFTAHRES